MQSTKFLTVNHSCDNVEIAYRQQIRNGSNASAGIVWLGGFNSDMLGTKAEALSGWAQQNDKSFLRFDYSGHGESGGKFIKGTISRWLEETIQIFNHCTKEPQIIIGSSMGGWISLLLARYFQQNTSERAPIVGMILIAPAPDFTEELMWKKFSQEIKDEIISMGVHYKPSDYGEAPYPITYALIEDGRKHCLFEQDLMFDFPIHILQGQKDIDVPWQHAETLFKRLAQNEAMITFIKDGDHRLSQDKDINLLIHALQNMYSNVT